MQSRLLLFDGGQKAKLTRGCEDCWKETASKFQKKWHFNQYKLHSATTAQQQHRCQSALWCRGIIYHAFSFILLYLPLSTYDLLLRSTSVRDTKSMPCVTVKSNTVLQF